MTDDGPAETQSKSSASDDVAKLSLSIMQKAAALMRAANSLPKSSDEYDVCMSYPAFAEFMEVERTMILKILQKLYTTVGVKMRIPKAVDEAELLEQVVGSNDLVAERVGILLDEIDRTNRHEAVIVPKVISQAKSTFRHIESPASSYLAVPKDVPNINIGKGLNLGQVARLRAIAKHREVISKVVKIKKPQLAYHFADAIDNSSRPFVPKLVFKHNSIAKKANGLNIVDESDVVQEAWLNDETSEGNPYAFEYEQFEIPSEQLAKREPQMFKSFEDIELVYVDTTKKLEQLRDKLNSVKEFAVDVEHHDFRSFLGITCLIQVSTRETDYIIDTFPLWKELHILNEPFTNPKILKVFHGAEKDILWLQRDFGIYVVNMFDTYRAMRHLGWAKLSLQYLVQTLCKVEIDKQYQTADWRIRPLSEEMINYARGDTHYLLFCHDKLRESLIESGSIHTNNLLCATYNDSKDVCNKVFEKPIFDPNGFAHLIATKRSFNNRQLFALRELWKWRDSTAREEDESFGYVLSAHMMIQIAETLPRDMQSILSCCSPVPVPVKEHLLTLHKIILDARDRPLELKGDLLSGGSSGTSFSAYQHQRLRENTIDVLHGRLFTGLNVHFDEQPVQLLADSKVDEGIKIIEDVVEKTLERLQIIRRRSTQHTPKVAVASEIIASPFECYLIAAKDRDKRLAVEQEAARKKALEQPKEKRYTHRDEPAPKPDIPVFEATSSGYMKLADDPVEEEEAPRFTEEQLLTKKALKNRKRQSNAAADINLDAPSKKIRDIQETAASYTNQQFDYGQYNPNMFEQRPSNRGGFNPFDNPRGSRGRGRGGRGGPRGGGHRGRGAAPI